MTIRFFLLLLLVSSAFADTREGFIGSDACAGCHQKAYKAWQGSHHQLAMQAATPATVLGNFDNATFTYNGVTSRFTQRGDAFYVTTDGEDGRMHTFPVAWVFGVYPLQQYLLPLSGGRLQALSIAWDARPKDEGGKRWYHLYADDNIDHTDPLHWTGPYQNWNARCAECHTTDFHKAYSAKDRQYRSHFAEQTVGCEACHGPGAAHKMLVQAGKLTPDQTGLELDLAQRGQWAFSSDNPIAHLVKPPKQQQQLDTCARCHSRRGTLGDYHYGADLLDTHRLSLLQSPLYHVDGQIHDEVYVYGSFLQSKMHGAGVVCSDCHNPHTLSLRAPGNGVCAQCHKPAVYDIRAHTHHGEASAGSQCVNCHMPETTYMGVDPRRDHSLRIPRPDMSVDLGVPNACTQCHVDKDAPWALAFMKNWKVTFDDDQRQLALAFSQAQSGDERAVPALATLVEDTQRATLWRATAMDALGRFGGERAWNVVHGALASKDPSLRMAAVRALDFVPLFQRYQLLRKKLNDPVTAVRMAMARSLAAVPLAQLTDAQREQLLTVFKEYESIQAQHADMPGVQLQLGDFFRQRGDTVRAEQAYVEALRLNPQLVPARLNAADLQRAQGRDKEARKLLLDTLAFAPEHAATLHALGLLEIRAGQSAKAQGYLQQAARHEVGGVRYRYVYAVALYDAGKPDLAIAQLKAALADAPQNIEVLQALVQYLSVIGRDDEAAVYLATLRRLSK